MWGEGDEADRDSSHEKDESLRESEYIFLNPSRGRLSFLIFHLFNAKYFLDRNDDVAKDVIFGDDIGIGLRPIDDDELIMVLIVPNDLVDPIGDQLNVMIWLSGGEE